MKIEEIVSEACKLNEDERASIASRIIHTLQRPHHCVSDEEVRERISEAEADPDVMISLDELTAGLKRLEN